MTLIDTLLWPARQLGGFARNAWAYLTDFHVDDVLPPSVRDLINWLLGILPRAFGLRGTTPREQINANIILIGVTLLLSVPTLGAALLVLFLWVPLLLFGIARWFPAADGLWRRIRTRLPGNDDVDIPGWRSE